MNKGGVAGEGGTGESRQDIYESGVTGERVKGQQARYGYVQLVERSDGWWGDG